MSKLYPVLPKEQSDSSDDAEGEVEVRSNKQHEFRLKEAVNIRERLRDEESKRKKLSKNYGRLLSVCDAMQAGLSTVSVCLASSGLAAAATAVAAPAALGLEVAAIVCAALVLPSKIAAARFSRRQLKHESLAAAAGVNKKTAARCVSEAIDDGHMSAAELERVVGEMDSYEALQRDRKTNRVVSLDTSAGYRAQALDVDLQQMVARFAENATKLLHQNRGGLRAPVDADKK